MQGGITQDYSLAAGLEQVMPRSRAPWRRSDLHASDGNSLGITGGASQEDDC